jgi:hypothetical protein
MTGCKQNDWSKDRLVGPGGTWIIHTRARELGFPDRATEMVFARFWRVMERIASRRKSPLKVSEIETIAERCFGYVENALLNRVQASNLTLDEVSARRVLNLPPRGWITQRGASRHVS